MRRVIAWLCLLLAATNPFVSEARSAYGFALSIAEIGCNVIESTQEEEAEDYDGQDAVTVTAKASISVDASSTLPAPPDLPPCLAAFNPQSSEIGSVPSGQAQQYWRPPSARQRQALLQIFLF